MLDVDRAKKEAATCAVATASNDAEMMKAIEAQSVLLQYGTSCFAVIR